MKLPPLVADLYMGLLIYFVVKKLSTAKKGIVAAALFLYNPLVWYNSAVWGQMDAINNVFFILSLFFAFRKNILLAVLCYALSLYIKLSLLPLLPFYLIFLYFISGKRIVTVAYSVAISSIAIVLATLPISSSPLVWLGTNMPRLAQGELQNIALAAFNFWMFVTCLPTMCPKGITPIVSTHFLGLTLNTWGYMLFGLATLPLLLFQIKKWKFFMEPKHSLLVFSLVAFATFLLLPKMHDRYMYPFFPLFAMVVALSKPKNIFLIIYILLSVFHFSNLVYSWFPIVLSSTTTFYHIFYGPVFRWIVSLLTILTGVWLYITSLHVWKSPKQS